MQMEWTDRPRSQTPPVITANIQTMKLAERHRLNKKEVGKHTPRFARQVSVWPRSGRRACYWRCRAGVKVEICASTCGGNLPVQHGFRVGKVFLQQTSFIFSRELGKCNWWHTRPSSSSSSSSSSITNVIIAHFAAMFKPSLEVRAVLFCCYG